MVAYLLLIGCSAPAAAMPPPATHPAPRVQMRIRPFWLKSSEQVEEVEAEEVARLRY